MQRPSLHRVPRYMGEPAPRSGAITPGVARTSPEASIVGSRPWVSVRCAPTRLITVPRYHEPVRIAVHPEKSKTKVKKSTSYPVAGTRYQVRYQPFDGLVPALEEMAHPFVAALERPRVPREETPHAAGQRALSRPEEQMRVVREQGPGDTVSAPCSARRASRATKSARSVSSRKRAVRSIPRTITWWRVSGASRGGWRGMTGAGLS